jgi:DNA polymerase-3 subunit epsilon
VILLLCAEIDQNPPKMVKSAPKFHEIAKRIIEITEGTTLVGHNIDFDYRMLRQSFKRLGYDFQINT